MNNLTNIKIHTEYKDKMCLLLDTMIITDTDFYSYDEVNKLCEKVINENMPEIYECDNLILGITLRTDIEEYMVAKIIESHKLIGYDLHSFIVEG